MSVRRTWDKSYYEQKAKERADRGDDHDTTVDKNGSSSSNNIAKKPEFQHADIGAAGPAGSSRAFLKVRDNDIDLDGKVGRVEIIKPNSVEAARGGAGYYCEVCACLLKDSVAYLDHINGKRHQRALGYSMRVERVDVDTVKSRLENIKRSMVENTNKVVKSAEEDYSDRIAIQIAEEENKKKRKREGILLSLILSNYIITIVTTFIKKKNQNEKNKRSLKRRELIQI